MFSTIVSMSDAPKRRSSNFACMFCMMKYVLLRKKQKIWFEILRCRYSMESCPKSYAKIISFGYK
jgi:hypothetical protein